MLHLYPDATLFRTVEDGFHDPIHTGRFFETCEHLRPAGLGSLTIGNEPVYISHQVTERISPSFLMPARQVSISPDFRIEQ